MLLSLLVSHLSWAQNIEPLDDLMSPEEIWLEVQEQEEIEFFDPSELMVPMGFFDFLRPRPPEPPQKEWKALLLDESIENYGLNWLEAYELVLVINKAAVGPSAQTATAYCHPCGPS